MLSYKQFPVFAALGASLLLAACGSSSHSSSASTPAATPTPSSNSSAANTSAAVTLGTAKGSMGTYLVGSSGRPIYLWVADSGGKSSCSGACAKVWPPVIAASMPHVTGGVNAAQVTLVSRAGGGKQLAYKGHPLYYYIADTGAGVIKGEGSTSFGAKWWLVAPSGNGITTGSSSRSSSGSSSGGSASGGSSSSGSSGGGGWG